MVGIMKKIVICDIDGTIANNDHRQHYLEGKKDWEGFFSELESMNFYDPPKLNNGELFEKFFPGQKMKGCTHFGAEAKIILPVISPEKLKIDTKFASVGAQMK